MPLAANTSSALAAAGSAKAWVSMPTNNGPLMPALLFTIVVTQIPFLLTIYYSLQSWNLAKPSSPHWVGLRNYGDVFSDPVFYGALLHTIENGLGVATLTANDTTAPMTDLLAQVAPPSPSPSPSPCCAGTSPTAA